MHAFNQSLKYDQRMHAADIRGSIAYAKGLRRIGILTEEEEIRMTQGLNTVGREWENGQVRGLIHDCLAQRPILRSVYLRHSSSPLRTMRISTLQTNAD
jgi:hypothetical protein